MSSPASPSQTYVQGAVMTASPAQLQLMLYDGAIRYTTRGLDGIRARDREATFEALDRAQRVVLELANGLNRAVNPQLADQMGAIYSFIYRRLIDASLKLDEQAANEALRLLRYQRETWVMLMERIRHELHGPAPGAAASPPTAGAPAAFAAEA
ncbi:MAG: flagellar export chaperone FliS [Planctomycetota bacterium]